MVHTRYRRRLLERAPRGPSLSLRPARLRILCEVAILCMRVVCWPLAVVVVRTVSRSPVRVLPPLTG